MDLSESFWLAFVGSGFAIIGLLVRYSYKSKCKNIKCCCLSFERDIEEEVREDLAELEKRGGGDGSPKTPLQV